MLRSPRGLLGRWRRNEATRLSKVSSARGDIGRLGSRNVICTSAEEKLNTELPRVDVLAFLGQEEGHIR
jgi:hypothetical protein